MGCRGGWYGAGVGFGGGGRGRARLPEEDMALLIASILEEGPRQGLEVALELEERSRGAIAADADRVYPLLQYLVDRDRAEALEEDGKTRYQLSPGGKAWLERRRERVQRLWRWARRRADPWGHAEFEQELDRTLGSACASMEAAFREVGRALEDLAGGLFGGGGARKRRPPRDDDGPHRAYGSR